MKEYFKHTFKHTLIYSIGNFSIKFFGFLLIPVYTSHLTIEEFGLYSIIEVTINLLTPLLFFNISWAIPRYLPEAKSHKEQGEILFTVLMFVVLLGVLLNLAFHPFTGFFSEVIFQTRKYADFIELVLVIVFLQNVYNVIVSLINTQEKSSLYSTINVVRLFVLYISILYFIIRQKLGIKGILYGQIVSYGVIIAAFLPYLYRYLYFRFNIKLLKSILKFSSPVAFSAITSIVISFGDRYILKFLLGLSFVGVYALAAKFASLIEYMIGAFRLSYRPFAMKNFNESWFKQFHVKMTDYISLFTIFAALGISVFAKDVVKIISPTNPDYWRAIPFIAFLSFAKIFQAYRPMFVIPMDIAKKNISIPIITTITAVLNVILNFVFIPYFKIYGAILGSVISLFVMDWLFYRQGQRLFRFKYEFVNVLKALVLAIILYWVSVKLESGSIVVNILLRTLLIGVFIVLLFVFKIFNNQELNDLLSSLNKLRPKK